MKRFYLLKQPGSTQRKSSPHSVRHISPKPLCIAPLDIPNGAKISAGICTVSLVFEDGADHITPEILICSDGSLYKNLDESTLTVEFCLQISESTDTPVRLQFRVIYTVDGIYFEERILSNLFKVIVSTTIPKTKKSKPKGTQPKSKYTGVTWAGQWGSTKRPWRVRLWANGKQAYSGYYETEEEAHTAREQKAKELGIVLTK